jgi:hypothetical protein
MNFQGDYSATLPQVALIGLGIRIFARSERFARYYR